MPPLRLLTEIEQDFPLFVSFHLRELYLRKNLGLEKPESKLVFKNLNDGYLHQYIIHLMAANKKRETVLIYSLTLDPNQKEAFFISFLDYCETRLGLTRLEAGNIISKTKINVELK